MKKFLCLLTLSLSLFTVKAQQSNMDQGEKYRELLHLLDSYYTDTVNKEKLTDAAIGKVLEELDPHSSYILAKDLKKSDEPLVANFEGIGVTFQLLRDTVMVLEVIPSGPSERVGIEAGDKIVTINDSTVAGIKIDNDGVIKRLRGPKNTKVRVGIKRASAGNDLLTFVITRDKIPIYSIDASYMADSTTGYIKLLRFSASSMSEFFAAVDKLKKQGMKDLIMDLQGNTGGYLMTAIQLCDEFLGEKDLIVYTKGAHAAKEEYFSDNKGSMKDGKLIVLIDEGSASASEIFSGCMQDLDRGLVIGRRSFGKGLVQKPYGFPDGSVVRLTVAHYYTPTGRCIQRPYDKGKKDYYDEYTKRIKSGELFGADTSLTFPDSLTYYTKSLRKVYGGGGVVPEIFVPVDTSLNSGYYQGIRGKGILNNFCLEYVDKNRARLKDQYPTQDAFIANFQVTDELLEEMYKKGDRDSVKRNLNEMQRSKPLFTNQLKSLIARDMFDNVAFWRVTNDMNDSYKKALKVMHEDAKFAVLKPSKKELMKIEKELKKKGVVIHNAEANDPDNTKDPKK
ncbi:MAG: peptidase family [Bacteroidetes bacterium]|nr:peptidase family [Bacteroidota bacterium]